MNIEVKKIDTNDLNNLATLEDFAKLAEQSMTKIIKNDPIKVANNFRKNGLLTDEEYKEIVIKVRVSNAEEDFK